MPTSKTIVKSTSVPVVCASRIYGSAFYSIQIECECDTERQRLVGSALPVV